MVSDLTIHDLDLILESLKYTKLKFEEYQFYPTYEYKQKRIEEVSGVISKVRILKKEMTAQQMD